MKENRLARQRQVHNRLEECSLELAPFGRTLLYELLPAFPKEVKLNLQFGGRKETRLNKPIFDRVCGHNPTKIDGKKQKEKGD